MIRTRGARAIAFVVGAGLLASACSGGSSNATLPPERKGPATVYVALGGDDNGAGRRTLGSTWPHAFFRSAFPRTAVFYNLASPRAGAADVLTSEVGEAVALHPDVVTITLTDDAEHGTAPAAVEQDLAAAIARLQAVHLRSGLPPRVLVGTEPNAVAPASVIQPLDQAIRSAARAGRATVVDLGSAPGVRSEASSVPIARAFAAALHRA